MNRVQVKIKEKVCKLRGENAGEELVNLKITCHLNDGSYYFHQDGLLQSSN